MGRLAAVPAIVLASVLACIAGCSEGTGPGGTPQSTLGVIVSAPVRAPVGVSPRAASLVSAAAASAGVVYVSLPPGLVPAGAQATITNQATGQALTTPVIDGGFDPVPIAAIVGDTLVTEIADAAGSTLDQVRLAVTPIRPLKPVRTSPPSGGRDVPLNASIVIVFSEPIDSATLSTSSIQLLRGTTPVVGTVRFLDASQLVVVFAPTTLLEPATSYQLVVTPLIRGLDGQQLPAALSVVFTTGTTTVGPVATVRVLPETALVAVGSMLQLTAVATDTAGAEIIGQAVTWSSQVPAVASVSATGLVTALAEGQTTITATVGGVSAPGWDGVLAVRQQLVPVASVRVAPDTATVPIGGTVQLVATTLDSAGGPLPCRPVTWASSNPGVASVQRATSYTCNTSNGLVTGLGAGVDTITATSEGRSGTAVIRVVGSAPTGPVMALTPSVVRLGVPQFGPNPGPLTISVTNVGAGTLGGLAINPGSSSCPPQPVICPAWLGGSLSGSTAPATLTMNITTTALVQGMYSASIRVSGVASNSPQDAIVVFTIGPPVAPAIALTPSNVTFGALRGGANPATQTISVTNAGVGTLTGLAAGTITYGAGQPAGWLGATLSGSTAPAALTLSVTTGNLAVGAYTATLPVTSSVASNGPQTVGVRLVVGPLR